MYTFFSDWFGTMKLLPRKLRQWCFKEVQYFFKWNSIYKNENWSSSNTIQQGPRVLGNSFDCWKFQFPGPSKQSRCQLLSKSPDWTPCVVRSKNVIFSKGKWFLLSFSTRKRTKISHRNTRWLCYLSYRNKASAKPLRSHTA